MLIGAVLCLFILTEAEKREQYKRGQIDALTGNVKYHLVTNPDSTKTWEEK